MGRPSRFSSRWRKYSSARKIQRRWRKYRRKPKRTVHNQRYNRVQNQLRSVTVRGKRNPRSLSNRLAALEVSGKKRHDTLQFPAVTIHSWGVATNQPGQFMDDFLRIPPKSITGTIPIGEASEISESNVRDGAEVFIKSALIQFRLNTYQPHPRPTDASYNLYAALPVMFFHQRVVFTILQDMRPSASDGLSSSVPNTLPTIVGERPLESIYRRSGDFDQTNNTTMITCDTTLGNTNYSADNSLLSYDSTRFKKVHQSTITLNALTPSKHVEHRLIINRRAKYMEVEQQSGDPTTPNYPVNFNYLLFLSTQGGIDAQCNLLAPPNVLQGGIVRPPSVDCASVRLYFTDS